MLTLFSAIFQAGGLLVVIVEVPRSPHLACLVPVIVNAILNEHQIVVDIVAFVNKGNFPRSRLGEKQRGTVLAKWVRRSLQTEAQFAIRSSDFSAEGGDAGASATPDGAPHRASLGSLRSAVQGGSLRGVDARVGRVGSGSERYSMLPPSPVVAAGERFSGAGLVPGEASPLVQGDGSSMVQEKDGFNIGEARGEGLGVEHGQHGQRVSSYGSAQRLPGVDGRESFEFGGEGPEDEDWRAEAIMHMNLAGGMDNTGDMGRAM